MTPETSGLLASQTAVSALQRDLPPDARGRSGDQHLFACDPVHGGCGDYRGVNDLIRRRLANQMLSRPACRTPGDVVAWLGAMQSQDYAGAKWAIGLRAAVTDADVERACDEGSIIRTHILRQTWHFVASADIRWMLALSGPRVNAVNAHYYRKFRLNDGIFARSRIVLERALRDGKHLTRTELASALRSARIAADGPRLAFLVMRAELDAVICSGAMRGKQSTYALLDERVPRAKTLDREAALAELARRYFTSHGPATLRDYAWWSGLTVRDAKAGVELVSPALVREQVDGLTCWSVDGRAPAVPPSPTAHLLPNYDEYLIAYKDRDHVVGAHNGDGVTRIKDPFIHHVVIDGRLAGSWKRTVSARSVAVEISTDAQPTEATRRALDTAVARLGRFMALPASFSAPATSSWVDRR